ncbi:MAG: hypothetical protein JWN23_1268 [Rhodocyclales bacterium]|nr:hypothetical protein [Rhodocyclales bacterium]
MSNININSLLRFLLVGGTATALQYLIMAALIHFLTMDAVLASGIGFVISAVFNYWANARFTFRSGSSHRQGIPRFLVTLGAGCLINVVVLYGLTRLGVSIILSQLMTTGVVLIWNYTINAIWTFRKKPA